MKNKNVKCYLFLVLIFSMLLVSVGCGAAKENKAAENKSTNKVTVLKIPSKVGSTTPDIFAVGDAQGFFAEQNIKFDIVGAIPASQAIAAVVSGKIDVAHPSHINRTIAGVSAGAKVKAVVACQETIQRVPHMVGVIRKDSPIKNAQDLTGKKIGITQTGGCHEYTPYGYFKKNGIANPKGKAEIVILPEKQLEQALRQGDLDLIMLHKTPEEINKKGEFAILFSDYDVWGETGGATPFYFTEKFISEKPEVVKGFVTAMAKTLNWANANPDKVKEITAKSLNIKKEDVTEGYYVKDGIIKDETVTVWIDLLKEFGEIRGDVKSDQIYTNEFNPNYKK